MPTYRGSAIAVGALFILCSAAAILSIAALGAAVGAPVDHSVLFRSKPALASLASTGGGAA